MKAAFLFCFGGFFQKREKLEAGKGTTVYFCCSISVDGNMVPLNVTINKEIVQNVIL